MREIDELAPEERYRTIIGLEEGKQAHVGGGITARRARDGSVSFSFRARDAGRGSRQRSFTFES